MIKNDYLVYYEGVCNPIENKCFIGCDDDNCTTNYYYTKMVKYAPDLYKECGKDIKDCEAANLCLLNDKKCSIAYCDSKIKDTTCSIQEKFNYNNGNIDSTKEGELQVNNQNDTNL